MPAALSPRTSRRDLSDSASQKMIFRLPVAGRSRSFSKVTMPCISGTSNLPHCSAASAAIFLQRLSLSSILLAWIFGIARADVKGRMPDAPSSVAFWMIHSSFAPFGSAWASVSFGPGASGTRFLAVIFTRALRPPRPVMTALYSKPLPSKRVRVSPELRRSTFRR